ncbi:MAG: hypothetical protein KF708_17755 [Pirellulales bacterium]|nr:hypothetical protein [Pirellulales bacterium]
MLFSSAIADDNLRLVKLTISPAGMPVPAIRYRLTPITRDLRPGNAAALYYRAYIEFQSIEKQLDPRLPSEATFKDRLEAARQASDGIWLDQSIREFPLEQAKLGLSLWSTPLNEVALGATRSQAIWDLPLREGGVATLLPEIQGMRSLARLVALQAKIEIAEGRFNEAAHTLTTLLRLNQQVSESGTLISSLVGIACDGIALNEVEEWIDSPNSPNLYWALTALPNPPIDISIGLESEHSWITADIPYLDLIENSVLSDEQSRELLKRISGFLEMAFSEGTVELPGGVKLPGTSELSQLLPMLATYPSAKRELIARGRSADEVERMPVAQVVVLRWVQEYRDMLDEMIVWGPQPFAESAGALADLDERSMDVGKHPSGHLAALLLPAVGAARRAEVRLQQRVAFLRVIEALRLYAASHGGGLPASLDEIREVPVPLDPVSNEPFIYELKGQTATLRAKSAQATILDQRYEIMVRK